jgi:copper chaperone CopZ
MQFPTHSMDGNNLFYQISAIFLFLIFIFGFVWNRFLKKKKNITQNDVLTYIVQGMHCSHCANSVIKLVSSLDGVSNIQVDLPTGKVIVAGTIVNGNDIIKSIESLGYTCSKKE